MDESWERFLAMLNLRLGEGEVGRSIHSAHREKDLSSVYGYVTFTFRILCRGKTKRGEAYVSTLKDKNSHED